MKILVHPHMVQLVFVSGIPPLVEWKSVCRLISSSQEAAAYANLEKSSSTQTHHCYELICLSLLIQGGKI